MASLRRSNSLAVAMAGSKAMRGTTHLSAALGSSSGVGEGLGREQAMLAHPPIARVLLLVLLPAEVAAVAPLQQGLWPRG